MASALPLRRARNWRLITPDGTNFTASEVSNIPYLVLDLDYQRLRVNKLEQQLQASAIYLTQEDAAVLRSAAEILTRIASPYRFKRRSAGTEQMQSLLEAPHPIQHHHTKKASGI